MVHRNAVDSAVWLSRLSEVEAALGRVIRGKAEVIRLSLACLLARGHLLIEDVPGVGKTTLAQALARIVDAKFHRVQFTSDMLPSGRTAALRPRAGRGKSGLHGGTVPGNARRGRPQGKCHRKYTAEPTRGTPRAGGTQS